MNLWSFFFKFFYLCCFSYMTVFILLYISAIAVLWIEFIREVRWCWEESQPLPKMQANGSIDLSTCLINQKLQMVIICLTLESLSA